MTSPKPIIDNQQQELVLWMGIAISAWAEIEERLFNILWICLGSTQEHAAIIYYRTPTVDSRLSLVDEVVRSILPKRERKDGGHDPKLTKHWAKMVKNLRDHLATRGRIAHHPLQVGVYVRGKIEDAKQEDMQAWWEVHTSSAEALRERGANLKPLQLQDIQAHYVDLMGLKVGLGYFLRSRIVPLLQERVLPKPPPPSGPY